MPAPPNVHCKPRVSTYPTITSVFFYKYHHRVVFSAVSRSQGNSRNGRQGSPLCTVARPPGAFLMARRPGGDLAYRPPYSLFRLGACCHGPTLRVWAAAKTKSWEQLTCIGFYIGYTGCSVSNRRHTYEPKRRHTYEDRERQLDYMIIN